MHAYGHQWSCQLVYNPRMQDGTGLMDGEGVERLWSRLRRLIGITRSSGVCIRAFHSVAHTLSTASQRSRRVWLLDRHGQAIASDMRDGLGDWIHCRLEHCSATQEKEEDVLSKCGISNAELRHQWKLQRESQLSLRALSYPLSVFAAAVEFKHS